MMRWILLPICSAVGLWFTFRSARHQVRLWRERPPVGAERWLNIPFSALWYLFLAAFCIGLTTSNLFLR